MFHLSVGIQTENGRKEGFLHEFFRMREEYKVECGKEDGKWTITGEKQAEGHGMKRPKGRGNSL